MGIIPILQILNSYHVVNARHGTIFFISFWCGLFHLALKQLFDHFKAHETDEG